MTLALCAVACMSVSAKATINGGVLTLNGSNDVQFNNLNELGGGQVTKIKLVGDFRSGWTGYWLQNGSAQEKASITEIDMSEADMSGDNCVWSFVSFPSLKKVVWPKEGKITNIPSYAFKQTGIEELHIPGYIKFIRSQAIDDASNAKNLKTVFFDKLEGNDLSVRMHIERQAFSNNYMLRDVYILTEGVLTADNNAFPHWDTFAHADISREFATLHYPESRVELYVNLNHKLDDATASDPKLFHEWLVKHYDDEAVKKYHNGFYEFVNHGEKYVEPAENVFLRTYSHPTIAHRVPNGLRAYIANSLVVDKNKNTITVTLHRVNIIPAATGVIIYGRSNGNDENGNPILVLPPVGYDGPAYDEFNTTGNRNYLVGSANIGDIPTHMEDVQYDRFTGKEYINFILAKFSQSHLGKYYKSKYGNFGNGKGLPQNDWVGFFRVTPGNFASEKAYFKIYTEDIRDVSAYEIIIKVDDQLNPNNKEEYYRTEYKDTNMNTFTEDEMKQLRYWYMADGTKIEWAKNWGIRSLNDGYLDGYVAPSKINNAKTVFVIDDDDISSSISAESKGDNNYYTLQGVKVDNPTKGIFIKNGKKIILK